MGFEANDIDPCVMNKVINGKQCTLIIYVDDILILSENTEDVDWVLGMHIILENGRVTLSMESFIDDMLKNYGTATKPKATPATAKLFDLGAGEELDDQARKDFHSNVMRLMYLSQRVRPDIALAVIFLCTRVKCPTTEDKKKLDRVIGYR